MKILEVKGNFLIVTDTVSSEIVFQNTRNNTRFNVDYQGEDTFLIFNPINITTGYFKVNNSNIINVSEITGFEDLEDILDFLYVNLGGNNEPVFSNRTKIADYKLSETGNTPTSFSKLNMSGSVLTFETDDVFDNVNSRITNFQVGEAGIAHLSVSMNSSTGVNNWVEFQLRGYNNEDTLLFTKRSTTKALVKNLTSDEVKADLEFYFGSESVSYIEIWWRGSSAIPYTNPELTVIKY